MSRVFLSHSSRDNRQAVAVKQWLIEHELGLTDEIFCDLGPAHRKRMKGVTSGPELKEANVRCRG